jgi:hypothetical protein
MKNSPQMSRFIIFAVIFSVSLSASLTGIESKESMMKSYVEAYHKVMSPEPDPTAFLDLSNGVKQLFQTHPNLDIAEFLSCDGPTVEIKFILFTLMLLVKNRGKLLIDDVLIKRMSSWFKNPLIMMNICQHHAQSDLLLLDSNGDMSRIHQRRSIHFRLLLEYLLLRKKYIGLSLPELQTLEDLENKCTSS